MHKYPIQLLEGDRIVGDEGHLCYVYKAEQNKIIAGTVIVWTEFGPIFLDDDKPWEVMELV